MEKITIEGEKNSSIIEKISNLELNNYTIFAGENNSGKTSLINAISKHKDLEKYKKIYIPAESIQPQNKEAKNSVATSPFSKLLKAILGPIFDKNLLKDLVKKFDDSDDKKNFVIGVNEILKNSGVTDKKFDVKISEDEFKEDLIIKITKGFVRDLYKTDKETVDFEDIGMGTQRMIVAALIQYYEGTGISNEERILILFEEPEIYLHPKLKKGLYESLVKLSERENTMVLITTHDPYFIELGKKQKIYKVYRDKSKKDATMVMPMNNVGILPYSSDAEINHLIFEIPSKTYFVELYEHLLSFFPGESCPGESSFNKLNKWVVEQNTTGKVKVELEKGKNPLISKLRNQLAHPTEKNIVIESEDIEKRIQELKRLIEVVPNNVV